MEAEIVPVLHVTDAVAAIAWYERLGFTAAGPTANLRMGASSNFATWTVNRVRISRPAS